MEEDIRRLAEDGRIVVENGVVSVHMNATDSSKIK